MEEFSHKSINTNDFKTFLYKFYQGQGNGEKVKILDSVDWDAWFNKPGMPIIENKFDDSLARACIALAEEWESSRISKVYPTDKDQFLALNSNQKIMFLEKLLLKEKFPHHVLQAMDTLYDLTSAKNAEIRFRWEWLCLNAEYEFIFDQVVEFITSVGRMKFVRPLYR